MIAVLLICVAVIAVLLGFSYYMYRVSFVRNDRRQRYDSWVNPPEVRNSDPAKFYGKWEEICDADQWVFQYQKEHGKKYTMQSYDGLQLVARYLPPLEGDPKAIILAVHGYRSFPIHDFSISARDFIRQGFGVLMIDHRSHGESEGRIICYGVKERYDVRDWAKRLQAEFPDVPVILDGISMGAATVMAAAELDLPENVKAIVADCGYTSIHGIFVSVAKAKYHLPPFPIVPLVECWCKLLNGFDCSEVDSRETLSQAKVPVLLIHGRGDNLVPFPMSEAIYEKNKDRIDITFLATEAVQHGFSYLADYAGYTAALTALFEKFLK